jgi:hypothetical protein
MCASATTHLRLIEPGDVLPQTDLSKWPSGRQIGSQICRWPGKEPTMIWNCGSKNCPTHRVKTEECRNGTWFCGSKQPLCGGHSKREDRCAHGVLWSCGGRGCPGKHPNHRDHCHNTVWTCGCVQPPCPTHSHAKDVCRDTIPGKHLQNQLHGISAFFPGKVGYYQNLPQRKAFFLNVFKHCGISRERQALMLSMALIEASALSEKQIDHGKDDKKDFSFNVSLFNLNGDMLQQLGFRSQVKDSKALRDFAEPLNKDGYLWMAVGFLNKAFDKWGVIKTLYFVRGGRDTFVDGESFLAERYMQAVATSLRLMDEDPKWLVDDRRYNMDVTPVGENDKFRGVPAAAHSRLSNNAAPAR